MPPFRLPHWLRVRKLWPRQIAPVQPPPWLELDRVRTALSCIILICLLALIIIGGRKTGSFSQTDHAIRPDPLSETFLLVPASKH